MSKPKFKVHQNFHVIFKINIQMFINLFLTLKYFKVETYLPIVVSRKIFNWRLHPSALNFRTKTSGWSVNWNLVKSLINKYLGSKIIFRNENYYRTNTIYKRCMSLLNKSQPFFSLLFRNAIFGVKDSSQYIFSVFGIILKYVAAFCFQSFLNVSVYLHVLAVISKYPAIFQRPENCLEICFQSKILVNLKISHGPDIAQSKIRSMIPNPRNKFWIWN